MRGINAEDRERHNPEVTMNRLYRYPSERKIAGVCAGLGEYFEVDPLVFRLGFLAVSLLGGAGILVYAIMWVMVPPATGAAQPRPSNAPHLSTTHIKLGGVCGGLGEFFHLDPVLFRIGMVVLACFWGFGFLLYAILWLLMPRGPQMHGDLAV